MLRPVIVLGVLAVFFICESSCQRPHIILPTYRPPPASRQPVIMRARRDERSEPLWLYQGDIPRAPSTADHPFLPKYIDDVKLDPHTRVARSYGAPGGSRRGTGSSQSSGSRDTGRTHPGYNRRNARELPRFIWPTLPPFKPQLPGPRRPWDPPRIPIYV